MNQKIVELKARAYDLLAFTQSAQNELIEINKKIAEEMSKEKPSLPSKEDEQA